MTGTWVLLAALALTLVVAVLLRRRDGRFRAAPPVPAARPDAGERVAADEVGAALGERATLLQLSSAFCSPCRATRVLLADVAKVVPGVAHVEVDAESHLELVRRLDVRRTPTVLVLGPTGEVVQRASGVPRREQVLAALAQAVPAD